MGVTLAYSSNFNGAGESRPTAPYDTNSAMEPSYIIEIDMPAEHNIRRAERLLLNKQAKDDRSGWKHVKPTQPSFKPAGRRSPRMLPPRGLRLKRLLFNVVQELEDSQGGLKLCYAILFFILSTVAAGMGSAFAFFPTSVVVSNTNI